MLILGKWYCDTQSSYDYRQYTNKYKRFCQEHNTDSVLFDETMRLNPTDLYYGYWNFITNSYAYYYYLYNNGTVQKNDNAYRYKIEGNILYFGSDVYELLELNEYHLKVQYRDTTYFYDEDYEKQIAWVRTCVYQFNVDMGTTTEGVED